MKWMLLDALPPGESSDALRAWAAAEGAVVHSLHQERLAPCKGCFGCWVEHPGRCAMHDAANALMRDAMAVDVVLWATPVCLGSWDPVAKAALDRSIALVSPFFQAVHGETHHRERYPDYPRWVVLAEVEPDTPRSERELFKRLVARNALNLHSEAPLVAFLEQGEPAQSWIHLASHSLLASQDSAPGAFPTLEPEPPWPHAQGVEPKPERPRRALLWVGSAKPRGESHSEALGRALLDRLEAWGWETELVRSASVTRLHRGGSPKLVEAARRADLLLLSTPVYVDTLPALVLAGLQHLADAGGLDAKMVALVQCGFPEANHTALAVRAARLGAQRAGLGWAGHLAMGGGGAMEPLVQGQRPGHLKPMLEHLDQAAAALHRGEPVPAATTTGFAQPLMPASVYRWMGNAGWLYQAWTHGALMDLGEQTFLEG